MDKRLRFLVNIWLRNHDVSAFETFQRVSLKLISRHGGEIERAVRVGPAPANDEAPFEIHIVSFPDSTSFANYRADAEVKKLGATRDALITRVVALEVTDVLTQYS